MTIEMLAYNAVEIINLDNLSEDEIEAVFISLEDLERTKIFNE